MNNLQSKLSQFTGTQHYYSLKPFSNLVLTDGAKFLNDITPLVQDVAIAITHDKDLSKQVFLSITINVGEDGVKTVITDGDSNEVLYCQHYLSCDLELEPGNYKLFASLHGKGGTLMLASEY